MIAMIRFKRSSMLQKRNTTWYTMPMNFMLSPSSSYMPKSKTPMDVLKRVASESKIVANSFKPPKASIPMQAKAAI